MKGRRSRSVCVKDAPMTMQWKWTGGLSSTQKRWMKATAPIRESGPAAGQERRKACSTTLRNMLSASVSIVGSWCRG